MIVLTFVSEVIEVRTWQGEDQQAVSSLLARTCGFLKLDG